VRAAGGCVALRCHVEGNGVEKLGVVEVLCGAPTPHILLDKLPADYYILGYTGAQPQGVAHISEPFADQRGEYRMAAKKKAKKKKR
jgi:hypothetical protein